MRTNHKKYHMNLASRTLILASLCMYFSWYMYRQFGQAERPSYKSKIGPLRGSEKNIGYWYGKDSIPFNGNHEVSGANHLIMVAGHSIIISNHLHDAGVDEKDWLLLDYQKGRGLPQTILAHIRASIQLAAKDPRSVLIFSGGETRANVGPMNEGTSYFKVADAMDLWSEVDIDEYGQGAKTVRARTTTEEFATDSFQNLMFSICRFKEVTGAYPKKISIISFKFKEKRFKSLHAKALRWSENQLEYVGINPDESTGFVEKEAAKGELENSVVQFEKDLYGCNSPLLKQKRRERNPQNRTPPYELSCPDMKNLLTWCELSLIPENFVPW